MSCGAILLLLLHGLTSADGYEFRRGESGWELYHGGKKSQELPVVVGRAEGRKHASASAAATGVDLFRESWRAPVDAIRRLPASETGKQLYIAFLKRKYGYQVAAVNLAYGLEASAFTELESSDFAQADRARLEADDIEYTAELFGDSLAEIRSQMPRGALLLAMLPADAPVDLARRLAGAVDGFIIRDARQAVLPGKPYVLADASAACLTVRPRSIAACARISEP